MTSRPLHFCSACSQVSDLFGHFNNTASVVIEIVPGGTAAGTSEETQLTVADFSLGMAISPELQPKIEEQRRFIGNGLTVLILQHSAGVGTFQPVRFRHWSATVTGRYSGEPSPVEETK